MTQIALILHDIRSTYNVGSIFRSAECFGVHHIYISGYTPYPTYHGDLRLPHIAHKIDTQIAKTALGAEKLVSFTTYSSLETALNAAKQNGFMLAALEQDKTSVPIETYEFKLPTAIVLGNEVTGVDLWTKQQCDVILEIKQYGKKESLNVASASAIALYTARL